MPLVPVWRVRVPWTQARRLHALLWLTSGPSRVAPFTGDAAAAGVALRNATGADVAALLVVAAGLLAGFDAAAAAGFTPGLEAGPLPTAACTSVTEQAPV